MHVSPGTLILIAVFLLPLIWGAVLISIGLLEKIPVKAFEPLLPGITPQGNDYRTAMNAQATALGMQFLGNLRHTKFRLITSLWKGEYPSCVVMITEGIMLKMRVRRTHVLSPISDGTYLESTDEPEPPDVTGVFQKSYLLNADLFELYDHHIRWMRETGANPMLVTEPEAKALPNQSYKRKSEKAVEMGLGRYADSNMSAWRHTLKGAIRFQMLSRGHSRKMVKEQLKRARIKRPGDRGWKASREVNAPASTE